MAVTVLQRKASMQQIGLPQQLKDLYTFMYTLTSQPALTKLGNENIGGHPVAYLGFQKGGRRDAEVAGEGAVPLPRKKIIFTSPK